MPYQNAESVSGTNSNPFVLPILLTVPTLVIEIQNLTPKGAKWVRAGYLQAVSQTSIGEVSGQPQRIAFGGKVEVKLEIPAYPYQLRFMPKDYITAWTLELWTKDRSGPDGIPSVPLSEASNTATGWVIW